MGSSENVGSKYNVSVIHNNSFGEFINGNSTRTSEYAATVRVTLETKFLGPYTKNWLYVAAKHKSMIKNQANFVDVPYRPDKVGVETFTYDDVQTTWHINDKLIGFRSWLRARRAIVVVTGGVYGGLLTINGIDFDNNRIITKRPYAHNVNYESIHVIPIIKGYFKSFELERDVITAEIETTKEYIYG